MLAPPPETFAPASLRPHGVTRISQPPVVCFAIGVIGLGILGLAFGVFAEIGQTIPPFPGRTGLAYAASVLLLLCGIGLLFARTTALSIRVLFSYVIIGFLLQVPALVMTPTIEVVWEQAAELAFILSGTWVLFATRSGLPEGSRWAFAVGDSGLRIARITFGLACLPMGLSHFAYLDHTTDLVPAFLPFRARWAQATGLGHAAAGLGVLFSVVPRLAATMEAIMLGIFTTVVWIPRLIEKPTSPGFWGEFVVSWIIASSAWLVGDSFATRES